MGIEFLLVQQTLIPSVVLPRVSGLNQLRLMKYQRALVLPMYAGIKSKMRLRKTYYQKPINSPIGVYLLYVERKVIYVECRNDIITIGAEILGRTLTNKEVDELDAAMHARYDMYCEDYDDDVDVDTLFSEDFHDNLTENLEEMGLLED